MQVVIPMSGIGRRFLDVGYKDPKPLILVDGKPMIEHVVGLFPGEANFIFVCNEDHLKQTDLSKHLKRIAPQGKILSIDPHKLGPVYAVSKVFENIDEEDEVIVNYCDFGKLWDYDKFLKEIHQKNADGAIAAYRGFHPHMLGTTNYAFMRDDHNWMLEIQEKKPFTDNRMQEYASDGTYYFRNGALMKKYFKQAMNKGLSTKGEFYISMVYNLLIEDGLNVWISEIEKMLQWGTPQDLQEYQRWSDYFRNKENAERSLQPQAGSINLIPLAGRGQRFINDGYSLPKPLIEVDGKAMIIRASESMPSAERNIFVCLDEHLKNYPLEDKILEAYSDAKVLGLDHLTEGQACTCALGLEDEDEEAPVFIGACDNGMRWNLEQYQAMLDSKADCIVFTFRHTMASERNPHMYGWVHVDDKQNVTGVSVKEAISNDPYNDHAIVGAFYFRKIKFFRQALEQLKQKNIRVNGEFYVDSCIGEVIDMGLSVKVFELDHYICWGTPDDLKVYEYWRDYFCPKVSI